mgnify:CR=1 FL=1
MKNNECVIYMITKRGSTQIYQKDNLGWTQKSSKGITRRMTAEQFLSHLLPALTPEYKNKVWVRVEKKIRKNELSKILMKIFELFSGAHFHSFITS